MARSLPAKSGRGNTQPLMNRARLPVHIIHQQILPQITGVVKYAFPRHSSVTFWTNCTNP